MKLDKEGIKKILPHREPMLLVDTVEELTPGKHIITTFYVDPGREIFRKLPLFIGINNVRFLSKIRPGDTLRIEATIKEAKIEKAIFTCSAEVYDGETLAATGDVTLAMR